MPRPPALWEDDSTSRLLSWAVPVSCFLHVALFGGAFLFTLLFPPKKLDPPVYEVSLVAPVIKGSPGGGAAPQAARPIVGTASTPPPEVKATPAAAKLPNPDEMSVSSKTSKTDSIKEALERAKRQAMLEKLAAQEASKHAAKPGQTPDPQPTVIAASMTSGPKGAGSGEGTGNGGVDYGTWDGLPGSATYEQQIRAIVEQKWDPFTGLLDPKNPLHCRIRVIIGFDGAIVSKELEESSGNASFDASALAALVKVGKFPPPPLELKPYLAHNGLPLRFNSQDKLTAMRR